MNLTKHGAATTNGHTSAANTPMSATSPTSATPRSVKLVIKPNKNVAGTPSSSTAKAEDLQHQQQPPLIKEEQSPLPGTPIEELASELHEFG